MVWLLLLLLKENLDEVVVSPYKSSIKSIYTYDIHICCGAC